MKPSRAEGSLVAMLVKGLIPPETVRPEDMDSPVNAEAVKWLQAGKPVTGYINSLEDSVRAQFMADINSEELPSDPAVALDMARQSLSNLQEKRRRARIEQIRAEMTTADPQRKKELYALLTRLLTEQRS